jgi:hypothetical protein
MSWFSRAYIMAIESSMPGSANKMIFFIVHSPHIVF